MQTVYDLMSTEEFKNPKPAMPERELLIATLDRAVLDYYGARQGLVSDAADWLFNDPETQDIFTFSWVCDHLGLSPTDVRNRVKELDMSRDFPQVYSWIRKKVQSQSHFDNHQFVETLKAA